MKRLLVALLLVVSLSLPLLAQSVKYFPTESGAISFYDFTTHSFYLGARYPLIDYRRILYLDCVAITDFSELNGGLGLSCDLLEVSKMTGLNVHLTDRLNVGALGGYNAGREKWYWGFYVGIKLDW